MAKQTQDMVMTIEDLGKYLKISTSTLYKLCAEGKVPGQKVGRHWRFHKAVIDKWLGHDTKRYEKQRETGSLNEPDPASKHQDTR